MSVHEDRVLTCPHCHHPSTQSVAVSLDGEHAAQERQAILDGTFQRVTCSACGKVFVADGPLIYLDFDAKRWIGVFPTPWEAAWWDHEDEPQGAFQRTMIDNCPPLVRSWAPGFVVRAVFGIERLREKLVAHAAGIDDRVLEAYKLDLLRGLGPYELAPSARPRLREASATDAVFHVPRPEPDAPDRSAIVRIARAEIDRVAAARDGAWAATIAAVSAGPYVDLGRIFAPRPSAAAG
ncbi:MAG TPA: CpXC domain-containing protein [Kofleriaceae bacterium]|nr:CpXC domain-containing protein [Kofleriaceae bacterium]